MADLTSAEVGEGGMSELGCVDSFHWDCALLVTPCTPTYPLEYTKLSGMVTLSFTSDTTISVPHHLQKVSYSHFHHSYGSKGFFPRAIGRTVE